MKNKLLFIVAIIIIFLLAWVFILHAITGDNSVQSTKSTKKNTLYAYKELTGQESPLLAQKAAGKKVSDFKEESIQSNPSDSSDDSLSINKAFNHLFNPFHYDKTVIDINKQYDLTIQNNDTAIQAKKLEKGVNQFLNATFSWNYQNEDNRNSFLAFRAGTYFYDNKIMDAEQLYNAIHQKVVEQKLIVTVKFNSKDTKVYIHPDGGYVIDKKITLTFNQDDKKNGIEKGKSYTFDYRGIFGNRTPTTYDLWSLWSDNDIGILLLSDNYISNDLTKEVTP